MPRILKGDGIFSSLSRIQKSIQERADQIFHDRDSNSGDALSDWLKAESEVLTDINMTLKDNKDQVVIEGNIDKFLPEDIEIKAQDGKFMICGTHTEKSSSEKKGVTRKSSTQSNFYRSFALPDSVDTEKMEVKMKSGKFTAKIPKTSH
ncbi:MAG: Hsp20 family protein [Bacteroidota bacterium]